MKVSQADWYGIEADEALRRLDAYADGLTGSEATRRLAEQGPNAIPESQHRSVPAMLLGQFSDFMILVLLAAALISGLIGEPADTIAILVIVVLNAIIGTVQEFRAERAVAALREMAAPEAKVLRDGKAVSVAAAELVAGDVVLLEAGSVVPADLRLLEVEELQADESALTGESVAVDKQVGRLTQTGLPLGDRTNLVFSTVGFKGMSWAASTQNAIGRHIFT
jgi:Ca2+-transporting ATPase